MHRESGDMKDIRNKKDFEVLSHKADLKIRAYGKDLKELFRNALRGMFLSIGPIIEEHDETEGGSNNEQCWREIDISAPDCELLLVDFLSEALYLSSVNKEAYLDIEISEISETNIEGTLNGVQIEDFESGEIKAVTHHELKVERTEDGWIAEVLFDL